MLELWGAEYQESNALLLRPSDRLFLETVCQREKCPVDFVGNVTGDGKARFTQALTDFKAPVFYTYSLQTLGKWLYMIKNIFTLSHLFLASLFYALLELLEDTNAEGESLGRP